MEHNKQQENFSLFIEKNFIIEYDKNIASFRIDVYNNLKEYDKYLLDIKIKERRHESFYILRLFQNLSLEYSNNLLTLNFERKEHAVINYNLLQNDTQQNKQRFLNEIDKYLPKTDLTKKIEFSQSSIFGFKYESLFKEIPFFKEKYIPLNIPPYIKNVITNNNFLINYI
jgi:hypothetical protein